ncbi:MAG: hypothetical protein ACK4GQ_05305, partial [Candidatus Hadarchaeales archaeon]
MGSSGGTGLNAYGHFVYGGNGGGKIKLYAFSTTISGPINASGNNGQDTNNGSGGGSGGGILIETTFLNFTSTIQSNGGAGGNRANAGGDGGGGGGGSGGGIYIYADEAYGTGSISVAGGKGGDSLIASGVSIGGGGGGGGRVKIISRTSVNFSTTINGGSGGSGITGSGESGGSGSAEIYRLAPTRPTLLSPAAGNVVWGDIVLRWNRGLGADNHRLLIDEESTFASPLENRLLGANDNQFTVRLPEGVYYWKVVVVNPIGENESTVENFRVIFPPEILSIACDNVLVDRKVEAGGVGATRMEIVVRDNGGASAVSPENVRIWVRDHSGTVVVNGTPVMGYEAIDENTRKFFYVYDPPDTLLDSALGPFDVKAVVFDNLGTSDEEDFTGAGFQLFVVNDLIVTLNLTDNTPIHSIEASGNVYRIYDNASTKANSVVIVDNNQGSISANFTDNSYSKSYGLVSPLRLHRGDRGEVYVLVRDNVLDGVSPTLTYEVEGDNLKLLNFIKTRYADRTEVIFEAGWASDDSTNVNGTVYLSEDPETIGTISNGSGIIVIYHSSAVDSGNKTLSAFDNANRPVWNVHSQSFSF